MDNRLNQLRQWLQEEIREPFSSLQSASADASFRRYFRICNGNSSKIIMDAPPDKEPLDSFLDAASRLADQGVHVPRIYQQDKKLGFLLLEDLGNTTYFQALENGDNEANLLGDALHCLLKIQSGTTDVLTHLYDAKKLDQELNLFEQWYLPHYQQSALPQTDAKNWQILKCYLIEQCLAQPQVWVHRDFHSRNLMLVPENNPGVIDFQDMTIGPLTYDLASLLKDCYRSISYKQQLTYLKTYWNACPGYDFDFNQLVHWYDMTGLQRHLKVLGIFARLAYRDGKRQYLNDIPLVENYVSDVLNRYDEVSSFKTVFQRIRGK